MKIKHIYGLMTIATKGLHNYRRSTLWKKRLVRRTCSYEDLIIDLLNINFND